MLCSRGSRADESIPQKDEGGRMPRRRGPEKEFGGARRSGGMFRTPGKVEFGVTSTAKPDITMKRLIVAVLLLTAALTCRAARSEACAASIWPIHWESMRRVPG